MLSNFHLHGVERGARVVVAMSGGVDSSVAAALCHQAGYEVIGVTMRLYDGAKGSFVGKSKTCCGSKDVEDARDVALRLGIGHYVLDYESRFREGVIDNFAETYLRGETPLPCVRCNQEVKFSDLLTFSKNLGASALVSGHYVRKIDNAGDTQLHKAKDLTKDQSYFLFATTNDQLAYTHFPLGAFSKSETRELATFFDLSVAKKSESQDICFVPDGDYAKFITKYKGEQVLKSGNIVDEQGNVLGRHVGIVHYTVGQRRGLGLGDITQTDPLYVLKIDAKTHEIVVGPRESLAKTEILLKDVNWLCDRYDSVTYRGSIKIRSTMQSVICRYAKEGENVLVTLDAPQYGVAKGQAGVLYDDTRVLGGGFIL